MPQVSKAKLKQGYKADETKPVTSLISGVATMALGDVLTYGMRKYDAHNWRKGMIWSRLISALERHMCAFKDGEDIDPESGLPHVDHILCNAMFLSEAFRDMKHMDDRYIRPVYRKKGPKNG